jgi:hypothetical protein
MNVFMFAKRWGIRYSQKDGCGNGMSNVAGSECIKEKPEDNSKVSFVGVCGSLTLSIS